MPKEPLLLEAEQLKDTLVTYRRYLHTHPGCGFDLADTVSFVKKELASMGYTPSDCGKAGVTAQAGNATGGRTFLLRADMDALPVQEQSDVAFASQNGSMHACGHDMHTAMLLGAARLLKQHEDELEGTVKLMFQPAEEIFEGAKDMLQAGVLKNPDVDGALMIHVMAGVPLPPGTAIVSPPGVSAPGADIFEIQVQGKGAHGSMPNQGVDPVLAAAHIILAIQEIQTRELALDQRAVLTIGSIHAGKAANVIADSAAMQGSIRTYDEDTRAFLKKRLMEITAGIARTLRADAHVIFKSGCPALTNDHALAGQILADLKGLLGNECALSAAEAAAQMASGKKGSGSAGSEDFAYISQQVPSVMVALAAGTPQQGHSYPLHHPKVTFDENILAAGSAVYAYTAMRRLASRND